MTLLLSSDEKESFKMANKYIAAKRLKHGDGFIEPGEPIPDAESWKSLKALLSRGWVAIATADVVAVAAPPVKAKEKAKPQETAAKPKKQETKKEEPKKKSKTFLRRKKNDEVK